MFICLYTVCILLLNIYSCKKQIHVDESVLQILELADSFRCYLGSMVVKCLQSTGMYEYGKESKPLPVSVKTNVHMLSLRLNIFVSLCFLAHLQYSAGLASMDGSWWW